MGLYYDAQIGQVRCDSIVGELQKPGRNAFIGIFAEYSSQSWISLRGELNRIGITGIRTLIYSKNDNRQLGPERKAISVYATTLSLPLMAHIRLPHPAQWISPTGGIATHINIPVGRQTYDETLIRRYPGVTDVANALQSTYRPLTFYYLYGFKLDVWRLCFIARHQLSMGSVAKNIDVWNKSYRFNVRESFVHFTLGYRFYSLRLKKRDTELYKKR